MGCADAGTSNLCLPWCLPDEVICERQPRQACAPMTCATSPPRHWLPAAPRSSSSRPCSVTARPSWRCRFTRTCGLAMTSGQGA